jgi:hypothetical protein
MSKVEDIVEVHFIDLGVSFEKQTRIPFDDWPWKKARSHQPKCDFYLPDGNIYIEVKGFMTIHAMSKLSWFCRQKSINYYILHGTEPDWNPQINSPIKNSHENFTGTKKKAMENMIAFQTKELQWLVDNNPSAASALSLGRLKDYISTRITEYTNWNGEWY